MNSIHNTAIIADTVNLGKNVIIGPYCVIVGNVNIGDNTKISSHCSIGTPGESIHPAGACLPSVSIGENVTIREFVTINSSLGEFGATTIIGDNCYLMTKSHIGHDATLCDSVVVSSGAKVGGHSVIGSYSYIGLNACTHQRSKLGSYCILGAMGFYKGESVDGVTWAGVPAKPIKVNIHNIEKNVLSEPIKINIIDKACKFIEEFNHE